MTERVIELGGVRFRVVTVSPTYQKLVPVDDPRWFLRAVHELLLPQEPKGRLK